MSDDETITGTATDGGDLVFDGTYYDYRDAEGNRGLKMWVPPDTRPLRGILFHGNPGGSGDTRNVTRDMQLRQFAARYDLAIMGVYHYPGRTVYGETGRQIIQALDDWAAMGVHPEIAHLPMIARGSSNAGVTAYAMACLVPERMICFTPNVGPRYGSAEVTEAVRRVPGWMHVGPTDPFFKAGMEETRALFAEHRPRGALWAWDAEQGKGHEIRHIDDVDMAFYVWALEHRLPTDADGRDGLIQLREVAEESGWLADPDSWEDGITHIASWADYDRDRDRAVWLANEDMAFLYRAIASYDNPLSINIRGVEAVRNEYGEGTLLRSVGGNVLEPGREVTVDCDAAGMPGWTKIEFYDGARLLGTVRPGEPTSCTFTVDGDRKVYALTALGYTADGERRTSYPKHFIVKDPRIDAALQAQRAEELTPPPMPPRPEPGATAAEAGVDGPAVEGGPRTLVAYGLTAEMERSFTRNGRISPFWSRIEGDDSIAVVDRRRHSTQAKGEAGGDDDVRLIVKAAYSRAGLYLYYEVADDQAAPPEGLDDAIDMHLARYSAEKLWSMDPPRAAWAKPFEYCLSLHAIQYQVPFGNGEQRPETIGWNFPDPYVIARREMPFEQAAAQYGIQVDVGRTTDGRRTMEWFLPWHMVGHGPAMDEPEVGRRFALVLGYNDADPGDGGAGAESLRWPAGVDPWAYPASDGPEGSPWGDLVIGPALD
jgi:hypothetical protein